MTDVVQSSAPHPSRVVATSIAADTRRCIFGIVGASSGNLVEWFDFYVYSFCAIYFAPDFFPNGNPTTQLLNTAGVFAAGLLMRPIGGWRVPFVIGALAALVALYLRSSLTETSTEETRARKEAGTLAGLMKHKSAFFTVVAFTAGGSLIFYTFTTYMPKYLVNTAGMYAKTASAVMTFALLVYMLLRPRRYLTHAGSEQSRLSAQRALTCRMAGGASRHALLLTLS